MTDTPDRATTEPADWSDLPRDLYVTRVLRPDHVVWEVSACSVPLAIGPEVRYVRADAYAAAVIRAEAAERRITADTDEGLWRFWNRKALEAGEKNVAQRGERDALTAEVARLREALAPFIAAAERVKASEARGRHYPDTVGFGMGLTIGDLRRAAALQEPKP